MQLNEVVEAEGHLIDSHIMEQIFDKVVEHNGRVEAPGHDDMQHLLQELLGLGCSPVDSADAQLRRVERDRCAPDDFYSTTNHRTLVRVGQEWVTVENQRMDALIVVEDARAFCR